MASPRNIVFIVVDTLRADRLGCYGHDRPTSPFLDDLAQRSTVLDALWSASNFTAPAFTSIFTGISPDRHGVFDFGAQLGSSPIHQALETAGVRTGGVVTFRFFRRLLGKVWGEMEAITDGRSFNYDKNSPRAVSEGAEEWLDAHGADGPFCLFLHYDAPHMPYRLPAEYESMFDTVDPGRVDPDALHMLFPQGEEHIHGQEGGHVLQMFDWIEQVSRGRRHLNADTVAWMKDKYDASVRYNDDQIARVFDKLEQLGLHENTVVGVFSDHGEELLEHGFLGHGGIHMYEEMIRTVGIVHDPEREPARVAAPRGHVGILPTLMARAGVPMPPSLAALDFAARPDDDPVFCVGEFKVALRQGSRKWIHAAPSPHLPVSKRARHWLKMAWLRELAEEHYDLASDPAETRNLASAATKRELTDALRRSASLPASSAANVSGTSKDLDDQEREDLEKFLKDMGYMK